MEYSFGQYAEVSGDFGLGDRYFAFSFGDSDIWSGSKIDFLWADNVVDALTKIRLFFPDEKLNIRSAVYGEWECNNFTISGHIPHNE